MSIITTEVSAASLSRNAQISNDGRYVAFSGSLNNNYINSTVFVQDLQSGITRTIETPSLKEPQVYSLKLSSDGSKIAFSVTDGFFGKAQVFVKNLITGSLQLANTNAKGELLYAASWLPNISDDGNFLAFSSYESTLVEGDKNETSDVFIKNLTTGELTLASQSITGTQGNAESFSATISADGNAVLFQSLANNLSFGSPAGPNLFVKNLKTGEIQPVNRNANGEFVKLGSHFRIPEMSADGSKVAFQSTTAHIDTRIDRPTHQVMLKDLQTGSLAIAFSDAQANVMPGDSRLVGLSADGQYVTLQGLSNVREKPSPIFIYNADGTDSQIPYNLLFGTTEIYQKNLQTGALNTITTKGLPHIAAAPTSISKNGQHLLIDMFPSSLWSLSLNNDNSLMPEAQSSIALPSLDFGKGPHLFAMHLENTPTNGNNGMFGSTGADQLSGGVGNDSYLINHSADYIVEQADAGKDVAVSQIAEFTLPANVENLHLSDNTAQLALPTLPLNGIGNALDNVLAGNSANNSLFGLEGNDVLSGGKGNNVLDGGPGFDRAVYASKAAQFTIQPTADGIQVSSVSSFGGGINDTLRGIERIQFSDQCYSLKGDHNAASTYRLYQAAFNRAPDSFGLGYWTNKIDKGAQLSEVAQGFMQSLEFKNMYGATPSSGELVQNLYQNVLHRAPDASGLQYWTGILDKHHATSAQVLAFFAESPENQAALVGVTDAGFSFPFFPG